MMCASAPKSVIFMLITVWTVAMSGSPVADLGTSMNTDLPKHAVCTFTAEKTTTSGTPKVDYEFRGETLKCASGKTRNGRCMRDRECIQANTTITIQMPNGKIEKQSFQSDWFCASSNDKVTGVPIAILATAASDIVNHNTIS